MIELSHQHARRLLRKQLDARLPESQWSALQLHLEGCADCRAYQRDLRQVERSITRALRSGWERASAPDTLDGRVVALERRARLRTRGWVIGVSLSLAAVLLFFGLGGPARVAQMVKAVRESSDPSSVAVAVPSPTPAPTARPGEFPAVVAYEDRSAGNSEIYLLNPGAQPENLTAHPAEYSAPAWSPDGEWVAFLSDRTASPIPGAYAGEPKAEVYVTDITGRRVVQLTHQPGVRWEGPLAWTPDGQSLVAAGVREEEGGQRWIYRIGLDGSGAAPLPGTRGGFAPKIARLGGRMAFTFEVDGQAGLAVYDLQSGERSATTWPANALAPRLFPGTAFDWSLDGGSLAYISAVPLEEAGVIPSTGSAVVASTGSAVVPSTGVLAGAVIGAGEMVFASQVMAVRDLSTAAGDFFDDNLPARRVAASRWPSAFRAVTWTPNRQVVILEDLSDARARLDPSVSAECWRIQSIPLDRNDSSAGRSFQVGGLCVEGGFDRGSWSPDGEWMVVRGRLPGEAQPGLYAVRMAGARASSGTASGAARAGTPILGSLVRLWDAADAPETAMPRVRPRLLHSEPPLRIDPHPVAAPQARLPLSDLSPRVDGPQGQLVYVAQNGGVSAVVASNPDGSGGRVLYASQEENRCPRWSPDGRQVALVSQAGSEREGLYLLYTEQQGTSRLRGVYDIHKQPTIGTRPVQAQLGCPVWSPPRADGSYRLAATLSLGEEHYLGIFNPGDAVGSSSGAMFFVHLPGAPAPRGTGWAEPAWSQDGGTLYLPLAPGEKLRSRIVTVGMPAASSSSKPVGMPAASRSSVPSSNLLVAKSDWGEIRGLAVIPNAPYLLLATVEETDGGPARFSMRQVGSANNGQLPRGEFAPRVLGMEYPAPGGANPLTRLPENRFGLVMHSAGPGGPAAILQYNLVTRALHELALVPDALQQVVWSPDGRWLVYTTESGLYGLDVQAALDGKARPVWLSPVAVKYIDWKE